MDQRTVGYEQPGYVVTSTEERSPGLPAQRCADARRLLLALTPASNCQRISQLWEGHRHNKGGMVFLPRKPRNKSRCQMRCTNGMPPRRWHGLQGGYREITPDAEIHTPATLRTQSTRWHQVRRASRRRHQAPGVSARRVVTRPYSVPLYRPLPPAKLKVFPAQPAARRDVSWNLGTKGKRPPVAA